MAAFACFHVVGAFLATSFESIDDLEIHTFVSVVCVDLGAHTFGRRGYEYKDVGCWKKKPRENGTGGNGGGTTTGRCATRPIGGKS